MFNPASLFKIKGAWEKFVSNHPKFPLFIQAVSKGAVREGTIIEVHVKQPTGEDICTNVKITQSDLELFDELKTLMQ